jgi:hypothetical protein
MAAEAASAQPANSQTNSHNATVPFAWTVNTRKLPMLHADLDYPVRQVVIDGELWMIFVPGRKAYGGTCPVLRFKGKDLEHIVFKDGTAPTRYFPPHDSYNYEPHPDSGDRLAGRKTQIIGAAAPEVKFDGAEWAVEKNEHYYEGQGMVAAKAGHTIWFTFQGPDIYWRAVAARDGGKADVFIDDKLQATVDCFFPECPLPYQFAFIKTGLDPKRPHTIGIVVRGDKNPDSEGTTIRHIGFEVGG